MGEEDSDSDQKNIGPYKIYDTWFDKSPRSATNFGK